MSIFSKLFRGIFGSSGMDVSEFVEDSTPVHQEPSDARNKYYEDLMAQQSERAMNLIMGSNEMDEKEARSMVEKIMPKTVYDACVVREADADIDLSKVNLEVAQDDAPAGAVQSLNPGLTPQQNNLTRNVDLYQVYARINPRILRHFVSRAFIGYPACTILSQHEVIGLCCAMPPEDAIAPGFTLKCVSQKHKKNDDHIQDGADWIERLHDVAVSEEYDVEDLCIKFGTYVRTYGIGIAIPRVELIKGHTFEEPYDPKLIKPGSFKGFTVVDPSRVAWDFSTDTLFDPMSPYYQKPEYLRLDAMSGDREDLGEDSRVHRSWLVVKNFREVGEDLLATYQYGGQPLSQLLYERVFCADTLANEIVALAMNKRTVVKDGNLKEMIANPKLTDLKIRRFNDHRNNNSIVFKEPGEQITQLETSLADLQPLSAQQYQYVAAFAGIPMTKLFKNVPSGLQATGQYEVEDYEETIRPIRKSFMNLLMRWFEMYIASSYPNRDDLKVKVVFNPFVSPTAQEKQQISAGRASMVCQLLQNHCITVTEGRAILQYGENETFAILANKTPELLKKIEEMSDPEKQQEMQMKMQQAMGGGVGDMPGAQEQEPTNPKFEENKQVFQAALQEIQGGANASGEGEGGGTAAESPEEAPSEPSEQEGGSVKAQAGEGS